MKRIMVLLLIITIVLLPACNSQPGYLSPPERPETVDLGCCVKDIVVRDMALLGANNVTHADNDFIMTLSSDKRTYKSKDKIIIWGTLEYVGDNDEVTIWHGCPFMLFSVTDGDYYNLGTGVVDILTNSVLEKGKVYHFDYQKSGGWDANAPDAEFWENFFSEKDLILPRGEYTITLRGDFSLSDSDDFPFPEELLRNKSGLECILDLVVAR